MNDFIKWVMGMVAKNTLGDSETRPNKAMGGFLSRSRGEPISQPGAAAGQTAKRVYLTDTERREAWVRNNGPDEGEDED